DGLVAGVNRRDRVDVGLLLEERDRGPDVVGRGRTQREARALLVDAVHVVVREVGAFGGGTRGIVDLGAHAFTRQGAGEPLVRHGAVETLARGAAADVHVHGRTRFGA